MAAERSNTADTDNALLACASQLIFTAVRSLPHVEPGDDLAQLLGDALLAERIVPAAHDAIVVTSKVVAKAEDRYVDLSTVTPSETARELAAATGKDPRLVEVILWDTEAVSRARPGVLIVRHRGGHVSANAGVDLSNARPRAAAGPGPWALRLPHDADASARALRARLRERFDVEIGIVISDSFGRPFRFGTLGQAIGVAGFPAVYDQRGLSDLHGRTLEATITAPADQLAAACDLVAGQAAEGRAAVHVRGLRFRADGSHASALCRPVADDIYL